MPIYKYQCSGCGRAFEELVRGGQKGSPPCPHCGGIKTQRLISTFAPGSSAEKSLGASGGDMPMCGRCGDFGPCGGEA